MRLFNRTLISFSVILLLILSLFGCNNEIAKLDRKIIVGVTVSIIGNDFNDVKEPHISYKDKNQLELQTFANAIMKAKKVQGIVDVAKPDYLLTITFEDKTTSNYYLWISTDNGSIMNKEDTHTIYTLPSNIIKELNKYIK